MSTIKWTKKDLLSLYRGKYEQNKSFMEIGREINKSSDAVARKFKRMNWESFIENPDNYLMGNETCKKWTHEEMCQLDAYLQSGVSYGFIANKFGRTWESVERKAQETNWEAWRTTISETIIDEKTDEKTDVLIDQLIDALILLSRHDYERLKQIDKKEFLSKINFEEDKLPVSFTEIKTRTEEKFKNLGMGNPETMELGEGTYIIVGDSHGKHTKTKMFQLLQHINRTLNADKIIHIGHLLDDNNDISYHWGDFKNLVIVSKLEELKEIQSQRNKFNFSYDIVRSGIIMGDLTIMNQDLIQDYVNSPIRNLNNEIFDSKAIVNCHRQEVATKASDDEAHYFASPGCLCEQHIINTIKQIDFTDNRTVKLAFYGGFSKYRRMTHMYKYWTQGFLVVHVDENGNHTIVPCMIQNVKNEYATSYFDKIITSNGVKSPTKKIFVVGDAHIPAHDCEIMSIQEQICKDYKPDVLVNLGDVHDYRPLCHHDMSKGKVIFGNLMNDTANVYHVLKRMRKWANKAYLMYGNHERFSKDFIDKFPQLSECLDFGFMCNLDELDYELIELKDVLTIGSTKFIHGDMIMFNQNGNKMEKAARTFGGNIFIGHTHCPGIRMKCYSVGLQGLKKQDYNEVHASAWTHGLGMCNQYNGASWPTTVAIFNKTCILNDKVYVPENVEDWKLNKYKVKLTYETE